ncbi:glycosyltransferase family 9 protein [Candidatus Berkelbacteria bacterium]|nr:glycosyltransferase family 9 protein [Candidatus Berkelbacteria bacterium]
MERYVYQRWWIRWLVGGYDLIGRLCVRRTSHPPAHPQRIVILALHQIGDVIVSLPTITAIRQMAPSAQITVVAGSGPAAVLATALAGVTLRIFDAVWQKITRKLLTNTANTAAAKQAFLQLLTDLDPDVVIVIQPDLVVNQLLGKRSIPVTIGFPEAGGGFWLTESVKPPQSGHQADRIYHLAARFATVFQTVLPPREDPQLSVERKAKNQIEQRLAAAKIDPQRLVIIHPFPSVPARAWLPERWNEVFAWLIEHELIPMIIGGKHDTWPKPRPGLYDWAGHLSLLETVALLKAARCCLAVNSGPGHLAAALGTPLVSIFSSANQPARWGPLGRKVTLLYQPVANRRRYPEERSAIPGNGPGNPYSAGITVAMVTAAVTALLADDSRKVLPARSLKGSGV